MWQALGIWHLVGGAAPLCTAAGRLPPVIHYIRERIRSVELTSPNSSPERVERGAPFLQSDEFSIHIQSLVANRLRSMKSD